MRIWLVFVLFFCVGAKDIDHFQPRHRVDRIKRPVYVSPEPTPVQESEPAPVEAEPPQPNLERPLPYQPLSVEPTPQDPPPGLSPDVYPQNYMPPEKLPSQGTYPKLHRQEPIQLQDEGNIMSHPMPQRNPGPSAVFPQKPRDNTDQRGKDRANPKFPFHDHPRPMGQQFHAH